MTTLSTMEKLSIIFYRIKGFFVYTYRTTGKMNPKKSWDIMVKGIQLRNQYRLDMERYIQDYENHDR